MTNIRSKTSKFYSTEVQAPFSSICGKISISKTEFFILDALRFKYLDFLLYYGTNTRACNHICKVNSKLP